MSHRPPARTSGPYGTRAGTRESDSTTLDRLSPLPLYAQIKRRLLREILGWSQPDQPFTTEQDIASQFQVSRATVRQAMSELVNEGYLVRHRGLGTFVTTEKVPERVDTSMNFIEQWASRGRVLKFEVLRCEMAPCPIGWEGRLQVEAGESVWHVLRLRRSARVPISLDYRYVNPRFAARLDLRRLKTNSLLDVLDQGAVAAYGEFGLECSAAALEDAEHLSLVPGDPVLTRHLKYCTAEDKVLLAGVSHYRADQGRWSVRVPLGVG